MFRRPLEWPAIPLPGTFDAICRYIDTCDTLREWLGTFGYGPFDDGAVSILHSWYFQQEARRSLWAPMIATLAANGAGTAAVFEPMQRMVRADNGSARKNQWAVIDWQAAEDTISDGLALGFGDRASGIGDWVCLCDRTAQWAIHSWGEGRIGCLTAEPALMDRVVEAVGGAAAIGKFISLDCAMNPEIDGMLDSCLDFFGEPPFIEMPLRRVPWLGDHLEAHPWLDKAFADL